jgi:hypothetical protein
MATKPDIYNGIPRNGGGKPPASTALTNTPAQKARLMASPAKQGSRNAAGMLPPSQPKPGVMGGGRAKAENVGQFTGSPKQYLGSSGTSPLGTSGASTRMLAPSQPAKTLPMKHVTQGAGVGVGKAVVKAMTKGMKSAKGAFNKMKGREKKVPA